MIIGLTQIIECALLAAGEPVSLARLQQLFTPETCPTPVEWSDAFATLATDCEQRGLCLTEIASGYCLQIQPQLQPWVQKLWTRRPPRCSRTLLETLALIAYRQPITRPEIEAIRGVAVNAATIKTLTERNWIYITGCRDNLPGKPALYGTTPQFLDYFNLKDLTELPALTNLIATEEAPEDIAKITTVATLPEEETA